MATYDDVRREVDRRDREERILRHKEEELRAQQEGGTAAYIGTALGNTASNIAYTTGNTLLSAGEAVASPIYRGVKGFFGGYEATPQPQQQVVTSPNPVTAGKVVTAPPSANASSATKPPPSSPAIQPQKPFNAATPGGFGYSVDAAGNRIYTMGTAGSPGYGYMKVHAGQNLQTRSPVTQEDAATSPAYSQGGYINGGYSFQGSDADRARFMAPVSGPGRGPVAGNETFLKYRQAEQGQAGPKQPEYLGPETGLGWKTRRDIYAQQMGAYNNALNNQAEAAYRQGMLGIEARNAAAREHEVQARLANEQAQLQQQLAQGGLAYAQGMNQFGYNRQLQQMRQQLSQLDPNSQAARDLQWRINALGGDNTQPERKYIPRTSEDALGNKTTDFYTPNQDGSLSRVQILDEQNDGGVKSTEQFERQKKEVMSKLGNKEQQAALELALQSARTLEQRQAIINSFLEKLK